MPTKKAVKAKAAKKTPPAKVKPAGKGALVRTEAAPAETIPSSKLLPVDVLLYRGTNLISRAIEFFDGTDVSHASLLLDGKPVSVAEAIGQGLIQRRLTDSVQDHEWVMARRLKTRPPDVSPVLARAQHYLAEGERYGYEQVLLLAFLALIRKPKITPIFKRLLTAVLEKASSMLLQLTAGGKQPLICSEFVYRCYDEALPEALDLFSLSLRREVTAEGIRKPAARVKVDRVHPESVLAAVMRKRPARRLAAAPEAAAKPENLDTLIRRYLREVREPAVEAVPMAEAAGADVTDAVTRFAAIWQAAGEAGAREVRLEAAAPAAALTHLYKTAADFVTPGDLLQSDSLMTLGKLA